MESKHCELINEIRSLKIELESNCERLREFQKNEEEREKLNQELHQDNFDLSQTVQRLKTDMDRIEEEGDALFEGGIPYLLFFT